MRNNLVGINFFGGGIFSDFSNINFTPAPIPDDINSDVVLIVYDHRNGQKKLVLSNATQENLISDISFDLTENGCGSFNFTLCAPPSYDIGYKNWVEIYLYRSARPWFSGIVETRPHRYSTKNSSFKFSGFGFFNQLDTCLVDKIYPAGMLIELIVEDIIKEFVIQKTNIVFLQSNISNTNIVTNGELDFTKVKAKQAFQTLADIAQNFVFGVDEKKAFFFRPISEQVTNEMCFFEGKHFVDLPVTEDPTKIFNRAYIKGGAVNDGTNFLVTLNDTESQGKYGIIETVLTAPEILTVEDATRWGTYQLQKNAEVLQQATLKNVEHNKKILKAKGKARLTPNGSDGTQELELFVKKTKWKISSQGVVCDVELGEVEQVFENQFLGLMRDIKIQELLQQSNVRSLS